MNCAKFNFKHESIKDNKFLIQDFETLVFFVKLWVS